MAADGEPSLLTQAQLRDMLGPELSERLSRRGLTALSRSCDEFAARIVSGAFCAQAPDGARAPLRGADVWESLLRDAQTSWLRSHFELEEPQAAEDPQITDELSPSSPSRRVILLHNAFLRSIPAHRKALGVRPAFARSSLQPPASSRPLRAPVLRFSFFK